MARDKLIDTREAAEVVGVKAYSFGNMAAGRGIKRRRTKSAKGTTKYVYSKNEVVAAFRERPPRPAPARAPRAPASEDGASDGDPLLELLGAMETMLRGARRAIREHDATVRREAIGAVADNLADGLKRIAR